MNVAGCPTEAELLDAIEGRLSDADGRRINGHLATCNACRELIESLAEMSLPAADPMLGMMLGEYLVEERIGQGGMGVVYRARQPLIGKQVAVKLLRGSMSQDPAAVKRLVTEAQVVNAIGHRGIIDIFSIGELDDGRRYIVMEYLVGNPLNDYLRATGPLTAYQALLLLDDVLGALTAAHGAGVIHRDLKPSNLFLVTQPDGTRFVKILDFGLSRPSRASGDTQTRQVMLGTPAYMSPELIRGGELGPWTDLYAVGVLAWQMLAGRRPFEDSSISGLLKQQLEAPVPALSLHAKEVPAPLEAWVMSLLTKDWKKRPHSTGDMRQRVRQMLHQLSTDKTWLEDEQQPMASGKVKALVLPAIDTVGRLPHPAGVLPQKGLTTDPDLPVAVLPPRALTPTKNERVVAGPLTERPTAPDNLSPSADGFVARVRRFFSRLLR